MKSAYIFWALFFGLALLCQAVWGDVPVEFFAFPVNVALMVLWAVALRVLYREKRHSRVVASLLDIRSTFLLLGVFLLCCLVAGLTVQRVTTTWWFTASLWALLTHLLLVTFRGVEHRRPYRARFALNHAGLLLLLAGGFFGCADAHEWRVQAAEGASVSVMYDMEGGRMTLPHDLQVVHLQADYHADGVPQNYEARLQVDGKEVTLRVNHPYALSWCDDLYLASFERPAADGVARCVLQLVRQPWRAVQWTGIAMLLAGSVLLFVQGVGRKGGEKR